MKQYPPSPAVVAAVVSIWLESGDAIRAHFSRAPTTKLAWRPSRPAGWASARAGTASRRATLASPWVKWMVNVHAPPEGNFPA